MHSGKSPIVPIVYIGRTRQANCCKFSGSHPNTTAGDSGMAPTQRRYPMILWPAGPDRELNESAPQHLNQSSPRQPSDVAIFCSLILNPVLYPNGVFLLALTEPQYRDFLLSRQYCAQRHDSGFSHTVKGRRGWSNLLRAASNATHVHYVVRSWSAKRAVRRTRR